MTGCPAFDDLGDMLDITQPDLLDIITPPQTHFEFIKTAVAKGIRNIICQKPFCRDISEAREAVELCEVNGVSIVVHENFRFQPWYRKAREAIQHGSIGQLHQITFRLRTGDGQGPKAYLDRQPYFQKMPKFLVHETAIHWIDTFRYLMGDPRWVYADLRKLNPVIAGEDAGYFILGYENGCRALFDGNRHLDHSAKNQRMTLGECLIEGNKGTMELSGDGRLSLRLFGKTEAKTILEPREWPGFAGDCVFALQSHVIEAMKGNGELENTARDYMRVLELEEAVYSSAERRMRLEV